MNYLDIINTELKPRVSQNELVIDLFAGCGGLSLGFEALGFKTIGFEMNPDAAATYNRNLLGECIVEKLTLVLNLHILDKLGLFRGDKY